MHFFSSPSEFHRGLIDIFSLYANRALRYGDSTEVKPLIPMYNLPAPVTRQLQLDLRLRVTENPEAAFSLADELWQDEYYEVKQTALFVLGVVPIDSPDPIIHRLETWLSPALDAQLISSLFSMGTLKLQDSYPEIWESFIKSFLEKGNPEDLALGLKGLTEGLKNPRFANLPAIYRLISPIIQNPDHKILRDLGTLVEALAKKSPTETGYFLRQALSLSDSPELSRLVKQCLPVFPADIAQDLKTMLNQ